MKNSIIYICMIAAMVWFTACDDDYENPTGEPNHFSVFLSEEDFENQVQVNDHIDFGDVSRGVIARTWTFPAGSVDIVGSENNETSPEPVVKAVFITPGTFEVTLSQEYAGNAFIDEDLRSSTIDTTYTITVLDSVRSSFEANLLLPDGSVGSPLTIADGALNKIEAGNTIQYTATSTGGSTDYTWILEGGDPAEISSEPGDDAAITEVKYKKLGVYDAMLISSRARPFGVDTTRFEDVIEITASTAPVLIDEAFRQDNSVVLNFSREMQNPAAEAANFTVTVRNNGQTIMPAVSAVRLDPDASNIIYLDLGDELLYNTDTITVSYTQGTLTTTDFYLVDPFADVSVDPSKVNLLTGPNATIDYGIETTSESNWPYLWWGGIWGEYTFEVSTDQVFEGAKSAYVVMKPGGGMIIGHREGDDSFTFPAEDGKLYEVGVWMYVESIGNNGAGAPPDLRFYVADPFFELGIQPFAPGQIELGKWVFVSFRIGTFPTSGNLGLAIRGFNGNNPEEVRFYMDNITVTELQQRP
ncbi:hypothetical protein FNH22_07905 [Fulvivirga sp. M361]|uniref:hypothetical protein n=1 Tax=Fulvivirga sp. M361 TaxID=2594266 RepID=UPI001179C5C4|nr:hypothetical protein [Fulvivirga sp. M361]TRX59968.1 hypothetical protein FNH22_07905 [Fulvivirga sp. M361]